MSLLSGLTTSNDIATEKDSVGGGFVLDSNIYTFTVKLAFLQKAASEALALVVHLTTEDGKDVRQQFWMTSGKEKGCKNYYVDKNGDKQHLPGFNMANSLCLLTVGKEISQMETETKVVNLYNSESKAEVPTNVEMLTELLGKQVIGGLIKQIVDKNIKDAAGNYVPSGETREENELDKLFRERDGKTTAEILAQAPEAVFIETWKKKWVGQVRDRATKQAGTAGAPKAAGTAAGGTNKPQSSLFS
jgi:hypothetical protein